MAKSKNKKYLHIEIQDDAVYVYRDNVKRFEIFTLSDMDNECHITKSKSIPISEFKKED